MTIGERFMALPRAVQWAIGAGVVFVLYFVAVEPGLVLYERFSREVEMADIRLAELENQVEDREDDLSAFEIGLSKHGEVLPPRPLSEVGPDVNGLWQELQLEFESLTGLRTQSSELGFASERIENQLVPPGAELVRVKLTANFDASPEDIVDLVGRLESSPIIHSVSAVRLRLNSADQRLLSAQIETESWAFVERSATR